MAALIRISYEDEHSKVDVNFNGVLTTAYVEDINTGLRAKGHAKQDPTDKYDQDFGETLAVVRARARLYRKIEKYWVTQGVDSFAERFSE